MRASILLLFACLCGAATTQSAELTITPGAGPVRLGIRGQVGREHILQSTPTPTLTNSWGELVTLTTTNSDHPWWDSASAMTSLRFYRVVAPATARPPFFAGNFQLVDHTDRSRELAYYNNYRAVVLVFTAVGCTNSQASLSTIKTLRDQFEPQGVRFLLLNASRDEVRTNIAAQATALAIDLPILKDEGQLVARELGVRATTEAFCFNTTNWMLFYRGALDDRADFSAPRLPTTQNYVSNALASFLAGRVITPSRTVPPGCVIPLPVQTNFTYATDIAPLLQAKCLRCHSEGNIGTWAMTNHSIVSNFSLAIKNEVLARRMPPWHADAQYGSFTNDNSLTPDQAALLVQWINDGAPRGPGADPLALAPQSTNVFPYTWPAALGTPDVVLRIPTQRLPAFGIVNYVYVNVTNTLPQDVWLRAAVVRPSNRRVVHHCLVYFGNNSAFNGLDGYFAAYVPGMEPVAFPAGTGKLLPAGTTLKFQLHYTTTGQAETDVTELGLYLAPAPPAAELQTKSAYDLLSFTGIPFFGISPFSIPPSAADYPAVTASLTPSTTKSVLLHEINPHMHYRGSRFKCEAVYPDNSREVLLSVPKYDFHWQTLYRFTQPKVLPAGTRLECSGAFDNSAQNRDNPDPSATVTFGDQTYNEMFIGYVNFSVIP
jgi:AhpC/TSA family